MTETRAATLDRLIGLHREELSVADEAERIRLEREAEAGKREAAINTARREVEDLIAASDKALSDSRNAYVAGAAAMKLHLQIEASLRRAQATLNVLAGTKDHIENQFELERKRSLQIASVGLKAINQHPNKFGVIHWPMSLIEWR